MQSYKEISVQSKQIESERKECECICSRGANPQELNEKILGGGGPQPATHTASPDSLTPACRMKASEWQRKGKKIRRTL